MKIDDTLVEGDEAFEVVNPAGRREITCAIHDVDGTHSLIRDWPPVMSIAIHWAMVSGLPDDFDSDEHLQALISKVGAEPLKETDQFCIESAGLSALTQMEYGIRRAIELGNVVKIPGVNLTESIMSNNSEIIRRIWNGEERFDDISQPEALCFFIKERTPRLFRLYEKILNGFCRDKNTIEARANPGKFLVPGSKSFIRKLHRLGVINYFVTGAVINDKGGMREEVVSLGFQIGAGKEIEELRGSSWNRKMPKNEVIESLYQELGIDPAVSMVIGDGRSEIKAGTDMGAVTMSRLEKHQTRQRQLHAGFGTNYIVEDFTSPLLDDLIVDKQP